MKLTDLQIASMSARSVGDLQDFLAQFPRNMPIKAVSEVDACREEGYPFIGLRAITQNESTDYLAALKIKDDPSMIVTVELSVDH